MFFLVFKYLVKADNMQWLLVECKDFLSLIKVNKWKFCTENFCAFYFLEDDDDKEIAPGHIAQLAHEGDDSEDEFSGPTIGNSEGESVAMTDQQIKQARGIIFAFM